jgi:hypothetical protein
MDENTRFSGWAKVDLFGHTQAIGYVDVVQLGGIGEAGFGTNMLRVRFPKLEGVPEHVKYFGIGAVYAIHPCTEEDATRAYKQDRPWDRNLKPFTVPADDDNGVPF